MEYILEKIFYNVVHWNYDTAFPPLQFAPSVCKPCLVRDTKVVSHAAAMAFLCIYTQWLHYLCSLFSPFIRSGIYLFLFPVLLFHFLFFLPCPFILPFIPPFSSSLLTHVFSCLIYLATLIPELLCGPLTLTVPSCFHCVSVHAKDIALDFFYYDSRCRCAPLNSSKIRTLRRQMCFWIEVQMWIPSRALFINHCFSTHYYL